MTRQYSILLLLIPALLDASCDSTTREKYSITTYFTSFDSAHIKPGNLGKKFKYSYEEYNSDSNLIYEEQYATPFYDDVKWGKLVEKTKLFYNGKQKVKVEKEFGIELRNDQIGRGKGRETDTYEYSDGQMTKKLEDGKPAEAYVSNKKNEQIEKVVYGFYGSNDPRIIYTRYTYSNGLKTKAQYFAADTINYVDTFIYKNNKLAEKDSYDSKGKRNEHRVFIREKGKLIEEKWKDPYVDWRRREDGKWIDAEFSQGNRYFYDSQGRSLKTEYYRSDEHYQSDKVITVYEFHYE